MQQQNQQVVLISSDGTRTAAWVSYPRAREGAHSAFMRQVMQDIISAYTRKAIEPLLGRNLPKDIIGVEISIAGVTKKYDVDFKKLMASIA